MCWGLLERSPQTPKNFSRIIYWRGAVAKKEGVPGGGQGGAEPARHWLGGALAVPAGVACLLCRLLALPPRCLVGGRGCFGRLPPLPFAFFPAPIPPPPLPGGKGETFTLFRRGLPPPAPRALNRLRHLQSLPSRCPAADSGRHHLKETDSCRFCGEPWVQPRGCRGRSPRRNKLLVSPFPTGEGGRGDRGQKRKLKAG